MAAEDWARLEWQSNCFASHVLIPPDELERVARSALERIKPSIEKAKKHHLSRQDYIGFVLHRWVRMIAPRFHVSAEAMERRLLDDDFLSRVP